MAWRTTTALGSPPSGSTRSSTGRGRIGILRTLVYQIDQGCRRLPWIGEQRTRATLHRFFDWLGEASTAGIQFVCSDMWQPYLTVIAKRATQGPGDPRPVPYHGPPEQGHQ
jgi:hypothetical protein